MSLIYSQDFSAFPDGTDVDPNVPNWVWSPQTASPNSCKVTTGLTTKYARMVPFPGEWCHLTYAVNFPQPYFELRARVASSTGFFETYVHQQSAVVFPAGYIFFIDGTNWAIGYDTGGSGFISTQSGLVTCNIANAKVRVVMNGSVMTAWVNDAQIAGANYDFAGIGNPYPNGYFGGKVLSNDGAFTDIEVYDAPVTGGGAALLDIRRRR